jgi:hypothetical protein
LRGLKVKRGMRFAIEKGEVVVLNIEFILGKK